MNLHRRCYSNQIQEQRKDRNSDIAKAQRYSSLMKMKTQPTVPLLLPTKTPKQWLQQSTRLLELINKTSVVLEDMRKKKSDQGYYRIKQQSRSKQRKYEYLAPMHLKSEFKPLQKPVEKRHHKSVDQITSKAQFQERNPLKNMLLGKIEKFRSNILLEADHVKLQQRDSTSVNRKNTCKTLQSIGPPKTSTLVRRLETEPPQSLVALNSYKIETKTSQLFNKSNLLKPSQSRILAHAGLSCNNLKTPFPSSSSKEEWCNNIQRLSPWRQQSPLPYYRHF